MSLVELYQSIVDLQNVLPGIPGGTAGDGGFVYTCSSNCGFVDGTGQPGCPASSFTRIGAAFATQGYFAHADLIWQLTHTDMGLWAPLLYILAAIGGLTSLAMGMPPKMYLWFFMGPAIYHFLLGTTLSTYGTSWCVANVPQDQTEVWKIAEVGLQNANITAREKIDILQYDQPSKPVQVSYLFLWFDALVSSTVQWMTVWTGVYQQVGSDSGDSGLIKKPEGHNASTGDQYYLLSTVKWPMLDRITGARLHNGDVRDALVTFMSSECGDALARAIEPGNLIAASNSKTGDIPFSVFREVSDPTQQGAGAAPVMGPTQCSSGSSPTRDYSKVSKRLASQLIPVPRSVRRSWWNPARNTGSVSSAGAAKLKGSLPGFYESYTFPVTVPNIPWIFGWFGGQTFQVPHFGSAHINDFLAQEDNMTCADLMFYVINGLRWEAGQIYYQLVSTAPQSMNSDEVIFNLFYGWDIRDQCGVKLDSSEKLRHYLQDLILVHLLRNELAVAPKVVDSRYLQQSAVAGNDSNRFIAETGAKQKFGEVYTWALMMPYVQGVLLYLLAMAYPFVCVMIVVPGWHKTLFTWMAFWTWVKLWDLGFAVVIVLERSIWAIMGNNSTAQNLSGHIVEMQNWATVKVDTCRVGGSDCPVVPKVVDGMTVSGDAGLRQAWENLLHVWDRAMLVGASIDIDVQSGYYIYIMSALYFAVPAVTGQLVLGAKAGAAGMVSNLTQGAQSDGGRAAGQAFTGALRNVAGANASSQMQASEAKDYRQGKLAQQAIQAGNYGLESSLNSSAAGALSSGLQHMNANRGASLSTLGAARELYRAAGGLRQAQEGALFADNILGLMQADNAAAAPPGSSGSVGNGSGGTGTGGSGVGTAAGIAGAAALTGAPVTGTGKPGKYSNIIQNADRLGQRVWGVQQAMAGLEQSQREYGSAALGFDQTRGTNFANASAQAQMADLGISQFNQNMSSSGFGMQERRLGAHAGFSAQSAGWEARRDYANQVSGYLGALGVDSSVVGPGPKPSDMTGMAMSGMLGSEARSAAEYSNSGGAFWTALSGATGGLQGSVGGSQVMGAYQDYSPQGVAGAWNTDGGPRWGGLLSDLNDSQPTYQPGESALGQIRR